MGVRLVRVLGAATAVFGAAITARPVWLAAPCGLSGPGGRVPPSTAALIRSIGARDAALGTAMLLGRTHSTLRTVGLCRAAADLVDAAAFGRALTGRRRLAVAGCAAGSGAVCALAAAGIGR